jgi:hypothetical protein
MLGANSSAMHVMSELDAPEMRLKGTARRMSQNSNSPCTVHAAAHVPRHAPHPHFTASTSGGMRRTASKLDGRHEGPASSSLQRVPKEVCVSAGDRGGVGGEGQGGGGGMGGGWETLPSTLSDGSTRSLLHMNTCTQ